MWRTIRDLRQQSADLKRINCEQNEKLDRLLAAIERSPDVPPAAKERIVAIAASASAGPASASVNLAASKGGSDDS